MWQQGGFAAASACAEKQAPAAAVLPHDTQQCETAALAASPLLNHLYARDAQTCMRVEQALQTFNAAATATAAAAAAAS
jgi:hypothetical protein